MNELKIWTDSKDAVFFTGFVLGALSLALLTALFRALKPDGVRALKDSEDSALKDWEDSEEPWIRRRRELQSANAGSLQNVYDSREERQTKTKEGIHP